MKSKGLRKMAIKIRNYHEIEKGRGKLKNKLFKLILNQNAEQGGLMKENEGVNQRQAEEEFKFIHPKNKMVAA